MKAPEGYSEFIIVSVPVWFTNTDTPGSIGFRLSHLQPTCYNEVTEKTTLLRYGSWALRQRTAPFTGC